MLLDLADRMLGEVLVDLGDDPPLDVGMEGMAQLRQRARRRRHDQGLGVALAHELLHGGSDAMGETLLLELVPVGGVEAAALAGLGALEAATGLVAALLVRRRIVVDEDLLG